MFFLGGGMLFRLVFAMRNELSFLYLRFPFSVAIGLCGKSLRCVSFVTTAWMECFVFILISERERERVKRKCTAARGKSSRASHEIICV